MEIGAFDGESYSNTSFLADQGWRGIYVEPVPKFCAQTKARHFLNSVDVIEAAVAEEESEVELTVMGPLTTSDPHVVALYSKTPWAEPAWRVRQKCTVKTLPLEKVLRDAGVPKRFDLLVIDVEGREEGIVAQLIRSDYRPKIAIIELTDRHASFTGYSELKLSHRRIRDMMNSEGCIVLYEDEINTVFRFPIDGEVPVSHFAVSWA